MKHKINFLSILFLGFLFIQNACEKIQVPEKVGPIPSKRQLEWQSLEYYAFIHFNMNTFTNKEWGYGDESPVTFDPKALNTDQWARTCKASGMKGIIITAKHHDGFCLWPSAYTEHSVKNSPWRDGTGDLIKELSESCKKYGLKMGIYLSPWDRNHPDYGKPEYITYFRNQLTELLTNYGEIFEVWFDGANGGDGYYGGANEERRVDKKNYYDWPTTVELVRNLQPNAVIFSDAGPDIRWVGNEKGYAYDTTWSPIFRDSVYAGMPDFNRFAKGQEAGTHWIPTESDVSIRPGWYYHPEQDDAVKSLTKLLDIYYNSVGKNSALLLNIPVNTNGLIHQNDKEKLLLLGRQLRTDFKKDLILNQKIRTSSTAKGYPSGHLNDGNANTFWSPKNENEPATITIAFDQPTALNRFMVQEYIPLGQRISGFLLEGQTDQGWKKIHQGTTVGNKRILRFETLEVTALRFTVTQSKAIPLLSNISVFNALPYQP